jgi:hypothetical protein
VGGVVAEVLAQAERLDFAHIGRDDLAAGFYDQTVEHPGTPETWSWHTSPMRAVDSEGS